MDILKPSAVIGTNSWGSKLYEKLVRGTYVTAETIKEAMSEAQKLDIPFYDLARDYGLGKAEKMIGNFGTQNIFLSAKYTPFIHYHKNCVKKSFAKDLKDFKRDYIDVYWLHLPTDIDLHLAEIIDLYSEGKVKHIGISNFNLEECQHVKNILDEKNIPLYGVQNHYSLICRDWETNGLLKWCKENNISFWAWAVLEEGLLIDPRKITKKSPMMKTFNKQYKKLSPLYERMIEIADSRKISVSQLAIAFVCNKGIVPICGCRKPYQVKELSESTKIKLNEEEIRVLEETADKCNAKIMGMDLFRPFVLK